MLRAMRLPLLTVFVLTLAGCSILDGRPTLLPNGNKALRKTPAEFAFDAAQRMPYPDDVPVGRSFDVGAEVDYTFDQVHLLNFSGQSFEDVEVWINESYVVHLPVLPDGDKQELPFRIFYGEGGEHFPTNNRTVQVDSLRLLVSGEAVQVPLDIKD